jgi:hypothetical protein
MMSAEQRAAVIRAAQVDSSLFTDVVFRYTSAPFHRRWHTAWNRPGVRVVQWSPVEHGKTQQVTGWALHRIGRDPKEARILWVGSALTAARKSVSVIKTLIETGHRELAAVFPGLKPGVKWTETQLSVAGTQATEKDYTLEAVGVEGAILGGRFTDVILDDICTAQTTYTAQQREKVTKWVTSTIMGRVLPGGRIICLGNAWYPDDVMHQLAARGYTVIHEHAYEEDAAGRVVPGSILWPDRFPLDRLGERPDSRQADGTPSKRRELGTIEAMRQLRCIPYAPGQGRFRLEWFESAMQAGLTLLSAEATYRGEYGPAFLGIDCGISEKEGRDLWGFWAMAVNPLNGKRVVLDALEERMEGPAALAVLRDWHRRLAPVTWVENNAAQEFFRQFAGGEGIPTRAHTTGRNKLDPAMGVASLGVELEQGLWVLPAGDERSAAMMTRWRSQCLAFAPGQHTGDLLMASWIAREGARFGAVSEGVVGETKAASKAAGYGQTRARYGQAEGLFRR